MNRKHKDLRHGQFYFNFSEWLKLEKGYHTGQNFRMADTFQINDEDFEELEAEYIKSLEVK